MEISVRQVRCGDLFGMTRVILASRGLRGTQLQQQIEQDTARFEQQGLVEMIESEALVAMHGTRMVGVMRYGEFEGELHLMRPEIDPDVDAAEVASALLQQFWTHMQAETVRAVFVDYPQPTARIATMGDLFQTNGFQQLVDRVDMRLFLTEELHQIEGELTFSPYDASTAQRFFAAFRDSFQGSLDPSMQWDAAHPELSFLMFRERFGAFNPDLWVLATDAQGEDVGFALFQHFTGGRYANDVVLLYMGVLPDARGRGYGEQIVREGLRRIHNWRREGVGVSLTVSRPNEPAAAIYNRLGFRPVEEFTVYTMTRI